MDSLLPDFDSFIIRFIKAKDSKVSPPVRGSIRHLQSGEERAFLQWQEAESFIQRYVTLDQRQTPAADLADQ